MTDIVDRMLDAESDVEWLRSERNRLTDENERLLTALRAIRRLAERSAFGAWRFKVADLVDEALPNG